MEKMKKFISALLAILILAGNMSGTVFAQDVTEEVATEMVEPENEEVELQEVQEDEASEDAEVELMAILYFTGRYKVVGSSAKIREGYSSSYAVHHSLAKGSYFDIVEVKFNWETFHYWGKTRQGRWTCLDNGNVQRVSGIVSDGTKYTAKAGALIENVDMLAPWCMYKKTAKALNEAGLTFITDALENGAVTSENIIDSFEKNIYKNVIIIKLFS